MPGLNLEVNADVQEAIKALDNLAKEAQHTGAVLQKGLSDGSKGAEKAIDNVRNAASKLNNLLPKTASSLRGISPASNQATTSLINLGRVVQDAPFGFLGIANNLNPLFESFGRTGKAAGGFTGAMKALGSSLLGAGGISLAISAISSALIVFGDRLFSSAGGISENKRQLDALNATLSLSKQRIDDVGASLNLISQIAPLLGKIRDLSEVDTIAPQVIATRFALADAEEEVLKAQEERQKAFRLNQEIDNEESKKLLDEANKNLDAAFKKRQDLEDKDKILTLQAQAAKIADEKKAAEKLKDIRDKANAEILRQAKFLEGRFIFRPEIQFTPLDTKAQEIVKARAILKDFFNKPVLFKVPFEPLLSEPPKEEVEDSVKKFNDFFRKEVEAITKVKGEKTDFTLLQALIDEKKLKAQKGIIAGIFGIDTGESVLTKLQKESIFAAQTITGVLTPAFQGLFEAIVSGESPLKAFFQSLGQSVQQLIQKLIAAAVQALILSAIFPGGVGGAKGFGAIFGKILGFAAGGIVSGPTLALIGEGVGTSRSNPEVVAPLDQLRAMLGEMGGGGSTVIIGGTLRGDDFRLQQARTNRRQQRLYGR